MSTFTIYLELGFSHILDWQGYDHILFVLALCAIYTVKDWKRILILVTAFTIGHSLTLALVARSVFEVNSDLVEFLIPVTILITAASNLFYNEQKAKGKSISINYAFALFFGLIHGMGFSNYFRSILGKESDIVQPLLAFNIGIELGQLIIVLIYLLISFIFVQLINVKRKMWRLVTSLLIICLSVYMITQQLL